MSGFDNEVMYADNVDFTGSTTVTPQVTSDGQILIGSTVAPRIRVGSLANNANMNIAVGAGTITLNPYNTAKWIVDPTANLGTHQTITAALAAASSGETIFIRPGTYTEDLTLKAGVNLASYDCDALTPNVTIVGKATFTAAGTVSISGIRLQTNSDFCLAVTGSAASIVNLIDCFINCTNNTGITFTSSSASSLIHLYNCSGDLATTGIAYFAANSAGQFLMTYGRWTNTGNSTTANTVDSSGLLQMAYLPNFTSPVSSSGTAQVNIYHSRINSSPTNTTAYTQNSSAANNSAFFSRFDSGSASALNIASGTFVLDFADVGSSNANAITGAGTIKYGRVVYTGSSFGNNVTTKTAFTDEYGIMKSTLQPAFLATHSAAQNNVTGTGTVATANFTTEVFDQNSNYDGTNTFTAPLTGRYKLQAALNMNDAATSTRGFIQIVTSNRTYVGIIQTPSTTLTLDSYEVIGSVLADMDISDTASVAGVVSGLAGDTADFPANVSNSYFSGYLVC